MISLTLFWYGLLETWRSTAHFGNTLEGRVCAAWLCPEEFSRDRAYELQQESASGQTAHPIAEFKRALVLDPASAYQWADLGETLLDAHRPDAATYCFQCALAAGPRNPAILVRAANFYFSLGQYAETMRCLSAVLRNPELSAYDTAAFLTYARMGVPIREILNNGIPQTPLAARLFLSFLMESGQVADSEATWDWISEHSLADDRTAAEFVAFLISNKEEERAAKTWEAVNSKSMPGYRHANWIFNGSFESEPKSSPLDWHLQSTDDAEASRVEGTAYDGRWSLQLAFEGKRNVDYHQVFQETVIPAGKWQLRAFVRTSGITTDQGIFLRIYDPAQRQRLDVRTDALTGTHDWTKLERVFEVGSGTKLLRVEIDRAASTKFDSKVEGTAWIDSVELSPTH